MLVVATKVRKMVQIENPRMARGLDILKDESAVKMIDKDKYTVKSQSGEGFYTVTKQQNLWGCTCPDYKHRKMYCKHIHSVIFHQQLKRMVKEDVKPVKPIDNQFRPLCCPQCHSKNVVRNGIRHNKRGEAQRFLCKDCNFRFIIN